MLSFLLFTGALQLDTRSLGLQRMPVLLLATIGTVISTLWWLVPGAAGVGHAASLHLLPAVWRAHLAHRPGSRAGHPHQGRHGLSEATEDYLDKFWELIDGVLNAVMFALIGLEMLVFRIKSQYLGAGQAAAVLLLARMVSVSIPLNFLRARRELALVREV